MPGMMTGADMAKLTAASGKDFDKRFLQMRIVHHRGANPDGPGGADPRRRPGRQGPAARTIKSRQAETATMHTTLAQM